MFDHEDIEEVRAWLRGLGFERTPQNGWIDGNGNTASIIRNNKGGWTATHNRTQQVA